MFQPNSSTQTTVTELTLKQRKWIEVYLETGNATEAAMRIYDCRDRDSAASIGWENLRKLEISELLESGGITDKRLMEKLEEGLEATKTTHAAILITKNGEIEKAEEQGLIEVCDYATRHKYLETALKLKKRLGSESSVVQTNIELPIWTQSV